MDILSFATYEYKQFIQLQKRPYKKNNDSFYSKKSENDPTYLHKILAAPTFVFCDGKWFNMFESYGNWYFRYFSIKQLC